jgi:uncharacterized protein YgfB (UPF0149 family)
MQNDDEYPIPNTRSIIAHLCNEVSRIMEDAGFELVHALPEDEDLLSQRLTSARSAASDSLALLAAAYVLHRRAGEN